MSKKSQKVIPKTKQIKKKIIQKTPIYDNLQGNRNKENIFFFFAFLEK